MGKKKDEVKNDTTSLIRIMICIWDVSPYKIQLLQFKIAKRRRKKETYVHEYKWDGTESGRVQVGVREKKNEARDGK